MECSLPVKNTFVHFGEGVPRRSLRVCKSEPAEPIFLRTTKHGHLLVGEGSVELCLSEACLNTDQCADYEAAREAPCLQTPDWTPRCVECPAFPVKTTSVRFKHAEALADPDNLIIKNTSFDFAKLSTRSLRICQSEPADPVFPSKWANLDGNVDFADACSDTDSATDTTASLDLDLDLEGLSIQTPELTPRRFDSPPDSLTASLMNSPSTQWPLRQVEQQMLPVQSAPHSPPTSPIRLDLCVPVLELPPPCFPCTSFSITLRLAEKGKLGVYLHVTPGCDTLEVKGIVPGQAVHSWNRQCLFGNAANKERYVVLGDVLVSVNGKTGWQDMLHECQQKISLKMTFNRNPWASFGGYPQDEQQ